MGGGDEGKLHSFRFVNVAAVFAEFVSSNLSQLSISKGFAQYRLCDR